jgi:hypothetical protein
MEAFIPHYGHLVVASLATRASHLRQVRMTLGIADVTLTAVALGIAVERQQ